jgi:hypothetical protein
MTHEMSLALMEMAATEDFCLNGDIGYLTDAATKHLALVIASLTKTLGGKRDWQQHIDTVEETGYPHLFCHDAT